MSNNSLVFVNGDGQIFTSSLKVAEIFEKEHYNVLRSIRDLEAQCSSDFNAFNFEAVKYTDSKGELRDCYNLTRDGFSLLVMGFTGEKALQWKVKFIEAFNAMEAELLKQAEKETPRAKAPGVDSTQLLLAIFQAAKIEGNQLALALDKVFVRENGYSALKTAEVQLIAPQQKQLYTPTEIGKSIEPPCSAVKVNKYLEAMGWQIKANDKWEAVNDGVPYAVYLDTGKAHSDGTPIRQMKWTADVIFAIQAYLNGGN